MQLIEYLLWSHQTYDKYNKTISLLGLILNHTQPIILGLLLLLINKNKNKNKKLILIIMLIYSLCAIKYSMQYNQYKMCTIKNKFNHLEWKWNYLSYKYIFYFIYVITLFLLFYINIEDPSYSLFFCSTLFISLALSNIFYSGSTAVGALWCFYIVFLPTIYYFLRINKILN